MADQELMKEERSFAAEIKREREERGWTQGDLALRMQAAGIPYANQTTVSRIENLTRPVRLMEAQAFSRLFGRTVSSMTNPDNREIMLSFVEINHRSARGAYVKLKEAAELAARSKVVADSALANLNDMYPEDEELDPETKARVDHLRHNLTNLSKMDMIGEAVEIFRVASDHARKSTADGGIPLLGTDGRWDGWDNG